MPSSYTGNPANGAWSPALAVTEPVDGDAANAASVTADMSKVADFIAFLQANAGQLANANTWQGTALFNAAVTIAALLTLNAGNISLTASALQSILKGGTGKLQLGTSQASDLELLANNVVRFAALATGGLDAKSNKISNVVDPAAAQDAATKGYVDGRGIAAKAWGFVTIGAAGAATVNAGSGISSASWVSSALTINLSAAAPNLNYLALGAFGPGAIPAGAVYWSPSLTSTSSFTLSQNTSSGGLTLVAGQTVNVLVFY